MAETYPLATPNLEFASIRFVARNAVSMAASPYTFSQQVYKHPGQGWSVDISLPPMKQDVAEDWVAFLLRLRGQFGTFLVGDPLGQTARGSASSTPGTPVVNGAGQTGEFLNIDGLPLSATGYLKVGDYIQIGTGATATLHKVLEQVDSDGAGAATLNLFPKVRTAPNDGAVITVAACKGVFRLASNMTDWDINNASTYGITFSGVEAV